MDTNSNSSEKRKLELTEKNVYKMNKRRKLEDTPGPSVEQPVSMLDCNSCKSSKAYQYSVAKCLNWMQNSLPASGVNDDYMEVTSINDDAEFQFNHSVFHKTFSEPSGSLK